MLRALPKQHPLVKACVTALVAVTVVMLLAGTALARMSMARRVILGSGASRTASFEAPSKSVRSDSPAGTRTTSTSNAEEEEEEDEDDEGEDGSGFDAYDIRVDHAVHPPSSVPWRAQETDVRRSAPSLEPAFPPPRRA